MIDKEFWWDYVFMQGFPGWLGVDVTVMKLPNMATCDTMGFLAKLASSPREYGRHSGWSLRRTPDRYITLCQLFIKLITSITKQCHFSGWSNTFSADVVSRACHLIRFRAHLTKDSSIIIQICWKFHFALIHIIMNYLLQSFAHDMTAQLSWHVQNFVAIW